MSFKDYRTSKKKDELNYEVHKVFGVLDSDSATPKELRLVSWNNGNIKYDLRPWKQNEDGTETPLKGLTFDQEELYSLYELLQEMTDEDESEDM